MSLSNNCDIFNLKYKSKTTCFRCCEETIKDNFSTVLITINEYEIKFKNLNNILNSIYLVKQNVFLEIKILKKEKKKIDSTTYFMI